MNLRKCTLEGIPYRWGTNLEDDEIRELYQIILEKRLLVAEPFPAPKSKTAISVQMKTFEPIEFKGRICRIYATCLQNVPYAIIAVCASQAEWFFLDFSWEYQKKNKMSVWEEINYLKS